MRDERYPIRVQAMSPDHLDDAIRLFRGIEAELAPDDILAPERGETGLRISLASYDSAQSNACLPLLAWVDGQVAGYALAVRVPKPDARKGFFFVDDLYVLRPYQRRGVARRLLKSIHGLATREGYSGVRLLVRPSNLAGLG